MLCCAVLLVPSTQSKLAVSLLAHSLSCDKKPSKLFDHEMHAVLCYAGASPLEVNTALMSAGSWGVVHEPSASGPLNADVLNDTNNVMVNTAMFHAVTFQPESLQV